MGQIRMARWTPAWFAAGIGFLCLALGLMAAGYGPPGMAWEAGESRAITHLLMLGWIGSLMLGASFQFVPVLAAVPLAFEALSPLVLGLWAGGTASLAAGFWMASPIGFRVAAALVPLAVAGALMMLVPPVFAALRRERLVWLLAIGLVAMALTVVMGAGFALTLSGLEGLSPDLSIVHATAGIGLWFGLSAVAVSLKFLSMFGLTPAAPPRVLAGLAVAGGAMLLLLPVPGLVLAIAAGVVAAYLATALRMLRARRLRHLDPSLIGASGAALALPAGLVLMAVPGAAVPGGALLAMGWLSGLTLSFMPKIIAFLTWMEVFGPRIGRAPVPPTAALTRSATLLSALALWGGGVAALALGLGLESAALARGAATILLLAALLVMRECLRVRRLSHLPTADRPPRPALFFIHP